MTRWIAMTTLALCAACYGDFTSTQPAGERFEGVPIDPSLQLACADPISPLSDGYHYDGMACLGCHTGDIGPEFTSGGTLYADPVGAMVLPGFAVSMIDAAGTQVDVFTGENGNFWTLDPIVFPATAFVSACPDVVPMPVQLTLGDCNGCHVGGDRITFSP